jgi:hypothetical protein
MKHVRQYLPWGLVALLLAWAGPGTWPIVPVEGDDQGVIFGVESMLHPADTYLRQERYLYEVQPGSYHLITALVRITGAPVEKVFGVATVVGALTFALAGAWLLRILFGWPLAWLLVVLLWCQEVTTAAFYSNTSALAGGLALLGVGLAHRPGRAGWLGAGLALAFAGWLRADSLLVAPACLGLAFWRDRQWRPAFQRTLAIATVALGGVLTLYGMSGTSVLRGVEAYAGRGYALSTWRTLLESPVLLLSPLLALGAAAGILLLVARRNLALILVMLGGLAASLVCYGPSLTTPKYFYYLVPFALIPALGLMDALRPWVQRRPLAATGLCSALLLGDSLLGLRTMEPAQRFFTTAPTWATLGSIDAGPRNFALVVGPGELLINADGFRLRTGKFFAPGCWHREKLRVRTDLAMIRSWLAGGRELTIYWANWLPHQVAVRELQALGFQPPVRAVPALGAATMETWQRADQLVHLGYLGYRESAYQPPGPAPASSTGANTYFIGDCANFPLTELADGQRWHLVSAVREGLLTLHQRR